MNTFTKKLLRFLVAFILAPVCYTFGIFLWLFMDFLFRPDFSITRSILSDHLNMLRFGDV